MSPADKPNESPGSNTVLHGHENDGGGSKPLKTYLLSAIVDFFKANTAEATTSEPGLMSAADKTDHDEMAAAFDSRGSQLGFLREFMFPIFLASPSDGSISVFFNLAASSYEIKKARVQTDSGTIDVTVTIDGTPVTGMNGESVSSTAATLTASDSGDRVIAPNELLGLTLANNSSASNLMISLLVVNKSAADA